MEIAFAIWDFLWENQIAIAFAVIFVIWFFVRGLDLVRWIFRKVRRTKPKT